MTALYPISYRKPLVACILRESSNKKSAPVFPQALVWLIRQRNECIHFLPINQTDSCFYHNISSVKFCLMFF